MGIIIPVHPLFLISFKLEDILLFITSKRFSVNQERISILPTEVVNSVFSTYLQQENFNFPPFNNSLINFRTTPTAYIDISQSPCPSIEDLQSDIDFCVNEAIETVKAYFVKTSPFPLSGKERQEAESIVESIRELLRSEYQKISPSVALEKVNVLPFKLVAENTPPWLKKMLISRVVPLLLSAFPYAQTIPFCNPFIGKRIFFPVVPQARTNTMPPV